MGLADDMPGIQERKDRLIKKLRTRFSRLDWNLLFSEAPALGSEESAVMSWFAKHQMHMNAHEVKNVFDHYAVDAAKKEIDLQAFLLDLMDESDGHAPVWLTPLGESPNDAHLALSGVSHLEFGEQYRPFPLHWGDPPNAQMKGHNGVVRDLPGGYGKGNAPMEKWVRNNMVADKMTATNERGVKPFPMGNYSLGCQPNADHA